MLVTERRDRWGIVWAARVAVGTAWERPAHPGETGGRRGRGWPELITRRAPVQMDLPGGTV